MKATSSAVDFLTIPAPQAGRVPGVRPLSPSPVAGEHDIVRAARVLRRWLAGLELGGGVQAKDSGRVLLLDDTVAARFCLGRMQERAWFGVQAGELEWFRGLPWFHVAVRVGGDRLSFVSEQVRLGAVTIPAFALAFSNVSSERVTEISRLKFLDIRCFEADSDGRVTHVFDVVTTISVRVVRSEDSLDGLIDGRVMNGHTNRSVMRSVK